MTPLNKRLSAMHALHGVTMGKVCRECTYWHMRTLKCEEAPVRKKNNWGATWAACGRWVKRG